MLGEIVCERTAPAFIWTTATDGVVPVGNSLRYAQSLSAQGIAFELHIYPQGEHGLSTCDREINPDYPFLDKNGKWIDDCASFFRLFIKKPIDIRRNIMRKGRITIPTDENYVEGTKRIADLWGADAVRDCDGTHLPKNALEIADKVYNTYFVVRGDNAWADNHTDELQSVLLMTGYVLAEGESLTIDLLKGYSHEQLGVNEENPKKYWQVFDRTTGEEIFTWEYIGGGRYALTERNPITNTR